MTAEEAIRQVLSKWGVSPSDKVDAIWCLLYGGLSEEVIMAVNDIERALGQLTTIKEGLAEKHAKAARAARAARPQ